MTCLYLLYRVEFCVDSAQGVLRLPSVRDVPPPVLTRQGRPTCPVPLSVVASSSSLALFSLLYKILAVDQQATTLNHTGAAVCTSMDFAGQSVIPARIQDLQIRMSLVKWSPFAADKRHMLMHDSLFLDSCPARMCRVLLCI